LLLQFGFLHTVVRPTCWMIMSGWERVPSLSVSHILWRLSSTLLEKST
jgi:hypothetical protein